MAYKIRKANFYLALCPNFFVTIYISLKNTGNQKLDNYVRFECSYQEIPLVPATYSGGLVNPGDIRQIKLKSPTGFHVGHFPLGNLEIDCTIKMATAFYGFGYPLNQNFKVQVYNRIQAPDMPVDLSVTINGFANGSFSGNPPLALAPVWISLDLRANSNVHITTPFTIECRAMQGTSVIKSASMYRESTLMVNHSTNVYLKLGFLGAGTYTIECVGDPSETQLDDGNRQNNTSTRTLTL